MPIVKLEDINKRSLLPGFDVKFVHSHNLTLAFWEIKAGSQLPEHEHYNEQISQVVEGKFQLTIGSKTTIIEQGEVAIIPPNEKHSGKALTNCKILDVFYPLREDYK
nr:cupin domain-containing protein [uncultured Allomuricauda sp.]